MVLFKFPIDILPPKNKVHSIRKYSWVTGAAIMEAETNPLKSFLDVLNRDQRTIITVSRCGKRFKEVEGFSARCRASSEKKISFPEPRTSTRNYVDSFEISETDSTIDRFVRKIKSRRWGCRRTFVGFASRLSEAFVVGVCLLTIVRVPSANSAPSTRHAKTTEQIFSYKPLHFRGSAENIPSYLHPCGKSREEEINNTYYQMASKESDQEILKHIIVRTKNALSYTESFRDTYVEKTFHVRFQQNHEQHLNQMYDWLPNKSTGLPKTLGSAVDPSHLKNHSFDEFLVNIYEYLQKFAVALEQVVADQKQLGGEFHKNFRMTEVHLKNVLCEFQEAMMERNVTPKAEVPRSIMKDDIRQMESDTYRNLRDWYIFRDFMNCLEYVVQVFSFIESNLSSASA